MAAIRERQKRDGTRIFNVQVRMAGYPARTASFPTRRMAQRWAKTIEAEMIEGKHFRSSEARRRTLGEAIDRYVEEQIPQKKHPGMHTTTLRWWKSKIGDVKLIDVTPALVAEHRDKLARSSFQRSTPGSKHSIIKGEAQRFARSPSTVNKYLSCLSHLFTIARKEWMWTEQNPCESVAKLRQRGGRIRTLSDAERKALLAATEKSSAQLHLFTMLALTTACRAGELRKLKWVDVELISGHPGRLLFRETKNTEPRSTWVQGNTLKLLKEHRLKGGTGAVFPNLSGRGKYEYHKLFKGAVQAAGITDFRFHDLRHSAATWLARAGATEQQLRAIGGWKSNVVANYVHLAAEDAQAVMAKLADKVDDR